MAKISQSQAFTKATIYQDEVTGRWMIEESGKDGNETFDLLNDVLVKWQNIENISLSIKCEGEYSAAKDDPDDY